jgi:hypothetical protein
MCIDGWNLLNTKNTDEAASLFNPSKMALGARRDVTDVGEEIGNKYRRNNAKA